MKAQIKQELHDLIDKCNNKSLLEEAKMFLETDKDPQDWWDELTEEDKNLVKESESEYEKGNFITHAELMRQLDAKKKTWFGHPLH